MTRVPARTPVAPALLAVARAAARAAGVTRSAHITNIDRIGIPVAIAVRPGALSGSLVVTAGKGLTPGAAELGALLEAVELASAEPSADSVPLMPSTYRRMLEVTGGQPADLLDLCPLPNRRINLDDPLGVVEAVEWRTGAVRPVPAELVHLPPPAGAAAASVFGASSAGLGCGFSVGDAVRHALLEVVERDVMSFHQFGAPSIDIGSAALPETTRDLVRVVEDADLRVRTRLLPNELGVPTAHVTVVDDEEESPTFVNGGFASGASVGDAVERALLEAVQSRVCFMHGGREDLPALVGARQAEQPPADLAVDTTGLFTRSDELTDVDDLVRHVESRGVGPVCHVVLRDGAADGLWAVRVIVPGCEAFMGRHLPRIGRRLQRRTGG